jgi:hypothetical protein
MQYQTLSDATPEQPPQESDDLMGSQRVANVFSSVYVERSETNAAEAHSRSRMNLPNESARGDVGKRAGQFKGSADELDHSRGLTFVEDGVHVLSPATERFETWVASQGMSLDHERHSINQRRSMPKRSRVTEKAIAADEPAARQSQNHSPKKATINFVTPDSEQAVDLAWPPEFGESMWPTLPPSPVFEVVDELAAMEREAEALRRLDREQRGTLWNA